MCCCFVGSVLALFRVILMFFCCSCCCFDCLFWTLSAPSWRLLCCLGCLKCPGSLLNLLRPVLEPSRGFLGAILAPSWAILGCFRSVLGHLGLCWAILALSCGCLGPSCPCLGPSWACLGLSRAYLGPSKIKTSCERGAQNPLSWTILLCFALQRQLQETWGLKQCR